MLDELFNEIEEIENTDELLYEIEASVDRELTSLEDKIKAIKKLANGLNARILTSDEEIKRFISEEQGKRGWLFRVAKKIDVEHDGQRKKLLDAIREKGIKVKKAKKARRTRRVSEEVFENMIEAKVGYSTVRTAHRYASQYGAKLLTPDEEIIKLAEKQGGRGKGKFKELSQKINVEYKGKVMTLYDLINEQMPEERKKARTERLSKGRQRKVYTKPSKKDRWYEYRLSDKELSNDDVKVLAPIFWEIINALYPYASSSATITRMLSSGAGPKFVITNYPKLYSSKRAFSDILKKLTRKGAFDDEPEGWKVISVIFRLRANSANELIDKLNRRMEKLSASSGVPKPSISASDKPSSLLEKVSEFYKKYREALIERGKSGNEKAKRFMTKLGKGEAKKQEHPAYLALKKFREKRALGKITPTGELRGKRVKIEEEIEDIEEEIADYEREVGAEFLEVSQPVTFTQNLINGLVIGFVAIGTLWATSKISDFVANWVSKWLKADEKYIKALGDVGAGILILNSPNIWRTFTKDEMPVQGKVASLVIGWGSIANGITLAIRNERLIKVSEMVDNAIEGVGKFITNAITQKSEEADKSRLQDITQTTDDWKISKTEKDIEDMGGIELLPLADTTEEETEEYIDYNLELEEQGR